MGTELRVDEAGEQFPAGLRVLAVDDEPTCLRILEILLTRCKYRVRTTNRALEALQILRENKFDLVISDVHMPDMDGLKLLELVGLEMDLPVIMLSANADPKVVMKGIDHGACDYLLKPIRVEELKNIWQHVVRKKKHDLRNQNISANQHQPEGVEGQCSGNIDPNENTSRKRKEQDDEVVEETDDNDDPSAPKKPRVVWSMDLHRKFVYAVNQLGLDKAVPKKILDLMNVEKLTRENVASHLQKYRVYLKRTSFAANRQVNMGDGLGNPDSNYFRRGGTDGLGSYHAMAGSAQLHNPTLNSYPPMPTGMLGQLNGLPRTHNDAGQFQQGMFPLLQGMPTALELEELRNINDVNIGGLSSAIDDNTIYSGFPEATVTQPSSVSGLSSHLPDHVNWSNAGAQPNSFALGDGFQQASLHTSSSCGALSTPTQMQYRRTDVQGQAAPNSIYGNAPAHGLNFYRQDGPYRPNFMGSPANGALGQSLDPHNSNFGGSMNIRQPNFVNRVEVDQQGLEASMQQNPPGSFASPNFGSLEDLATAMLRQHQSRAKPDGYFGPGSYPPRTSQ